MQNNMATVQAKRSNMTVSAFASNALPVRKGSRPTTIVGPLHIQCNGHGDQKYLNQLVENVLSWPHIQTPASFVSPPGIISIQLEERAVTSDSSAFISDREFARVLLGAPTIYLALPLISAHWAIVRGGMPVLSASATPEVSSIQNLITLTKRSGLSSSGHAMPIARRQSSEHTPGLR